MVRWKRLLGVLVGVAAALIVTEYRTQRRPALGAMLSECGGSVRQIVIQYVAGDTIALPVYQSFLPQLPPDVIVRVICPNESDFDDFRGHLGPVSCHLVPIIAGHPMTVWSRDRWIALRPDNRSVPTTLLSPLQEQGSEIR